jgi:GT2 family glycosyltransferase
MKLTIQIVNYNSREVIKECLGSVRECLKNIHDSDVLIINNDQGALSNLLEEIDLPFETKTIEVNDNIGFGRAHNLGSKEAQGDLLLLLNPDTKVPEGSLSGMLCAMEADKKVGIVGPVLVDFDGYVTEESFGSEKTPLSTIKNKFFAAGYEIGKESIFEVDWVSGGAMLIRKELFDELGGFDEDYFMYFEDVDLCLRAKKKGYKIVVNPQSRIFHRSGQSFKNNQSKKKYYYVSQDHYFRKNFGSAKASLMKILRIPFYIKNVFYNNR